MPSKELISNGYPKNRKRVFEIYDVDINDDTYNCHHIVTKKDFKDGLIDKEFKINALSNLYPLNKKKHVLLHQIINAADKGEDIQPFLDFWKELEVNPEAKLKKIKTQQ